MLIKCIDCGHMVSEKATKCPNCGCPIEYSLQPPAIETPPTLPTPIDGATASPPVPQDEATTAIPPIPPQLPDDNRETEEEESQGRSKNVIIGVIVGIVAALIAGGCVYFFLSKHNKTSDRQEVVQEECEDTVDVWEEEEEEEEVAEDNTIVSDPSGTINGYGYVDLGLSVKWATTNLGAVEKPQEYGGRYAWGETSVKSSYTDGNSETYHNSDIEDISGNSKYDAARAKWGGSWRMPTLIEMEELVNKCSWQWTGRGYKVIGPNGNSIYLAAAGYFQGCDVICKDTDGSYWSASGSGGEYACWLRFDEHEREVVGVPRPLGCSIRPVAD